MLIFLCFHGCPAYLSTTISCLGICGQWRPSHTAVKWSRYFYQLSAQRWDCSPQNEDPWTMCCWKALNHWTIKAAWVVPVFQPCWIQAEYLWTANPWLNQGQLGTIQDGKICCGFCGSFKVILNSPFPTLISMDALTDFLGTTVVGDKTWIHAWVWSKARVLTPTACRTFPSDPCWALGWPLIGLGKPFWLWKNWGLIAAASYH